MKRIITITAMLASAFFSQFSIAQNLVPNPSFEDTVACPTTGGQIYRAAGWQNWGITPDYFNSCNSGLLGTPINGFGNQVPVEGNAYAGLACNLSTVNNVREFFGRELSQPLVIGLDYYISFYVSLADISSLNCAINHIGAKFSTVPFDSIASPTLDNFAHVYDDSIISDTANWTKINGSFIADSAYTYVMFGNFLIITIWIPSIVQQWQVHILIIFLICFAYPQILSFVPLIHCQ